MTALTSFRSAATSCHHRIERRCARRGASGWTVAVTPAALAGRAQAHVPSPPGRVSRASRPPRSSLSSSVMRAAVDLGDVADDGEAEAGAGLAGVEPGAAVEDAARAPPRECPGRRPRPRSRPSRRRGSTVTNTRPPPYLAAFSTRLPSISSRSWRSTRTCGLLVAGDVDGDVLVEPVDRALDRLEAVPDRRAGLGRGAAADGAGAGEMVVDLAAHRRRLAADGVGEVGRCARWRRW